MLRGALAAALKRSGTPREKLDQFFGRRGLRTSSLMPVSPSSSEAEGAPRDLRIRPAPLTVRTCKRFPGCHNDSRYSGKAKETPPHGSEDTLGGIIAYAEEGQTDRLDDAQICERCGNVLVPLRGILRERDEAYALQPTLDARFQAHVGIDRRRQGAASGVLFTQEVLQEYTDDVPSLMQAEISAPPEAADAISALIENDKTLRIGSSISRGLGRCTVFAFAPVPERPPLEDRLTAFSEWAAAVTSNPGGAIVPFTLVTPALFVNAFLQPSTKPQGADLLMDVPGVSDPEREAIQALEPVHQVARSYNFQGWNGLARFPHATDQGLAAGSVLLYRAPERTKPLLSALAKAEAWGIGLRPELGFGRVVVADPLHRLLHEHVPSSAHS